MGKMLEEWSPSGFDPKMSLCQTLLTRIKSWPVSLIEDELGILFNLTEDLMHQACGGEGGQQPRFSAILDHLDWVVTEHTHQQNNHWTNLFQSGEYARFNEYGQKNFLAFAIEEPALSCVAQKLDS